MNSIFKLIVAAALLAPAGSALAKGTGKADKGGSCKLKLNVAPEGTEIIIDGQKRGTAEKTKEVMLSPGTHDLDFKYKGDEHTDQVTLKKGQTTSFEWKFEDDRPKPPPPDDDAPAPGTPAPAPDAPAPSPDKGTAP